MLDPNTLAVLSRFGISADAAEAAISGMLLPTAISLLAAIATAMLTKKKGRSVALWLILAPNFPLVPLLLVWLLPAVKQEH